MKDVTQITVSEAVEIIEAHNNPEFLEHQLTQACAIRAITPKELEGMGKFELKALLPSFTQNLMLSLINFCYEEKLRKIQEEVHFKYPASTWQYFKAQYFPRWLLLKFPAKYKYKTKLVTCELTAVAIEKSREWIEKYKYNGGRKLLVFKDISRTLEE